MYSCINVPRTATVVLSSLIVQSHWQHKKLWHISVHRWTQFRTLTSHQLSFPLHNQQTYRSESGSEGLMLASWHRGYSLKHCGEFIAYYGFCRSLFKATVYPSVATRSNPGLGIMQQSGKKDFWLGTLGEFFWIFQRTEQCCQSGLYRATAPILTSRPQFVRGP